MDGVGVSDSIPEEEEEAVPTVASTGERCVVGTTRNTFAEMTRTRTEDVLSRVPGARLWAKWMGNSEPTLSNRHIWTMVRNDDSTVARPSALAAAIKVARSCMAQERRALSTWVNTSSKRIPVDVYISCEGRTRVHSLVGRGDSEAWRFIWCGKGGSSV